MTVYSAAAVRMRPRWLSAALLLMALCVCALGLLGMAEMYPQSGDTVYKSDGSYIDASYSDQGYIQVMHKATNKKIKVRIAMGDNTLDYDLNGEGEYEVFPLQWGSGTYKVTFYLQISGNRYSAEYSKNIKVTLADENLPFLYPNQYVWFEPDYAAVATAKEICAGLNSDREKFDAVADYINRHVMYDFFLAMSVKSGYLPNVDTTLSTGKGICFDYASLLAAMLRSQDIPCRLVIGYADSRYHAWNSVYLDGQWEDYDPTFVSTGGKVKQYTAQRVY